MAERRTEHGMDERLAALLNVERALEARVQARAAAAREKVEAARALLRAAQAGSPPGLEEVAANEAHADEAAHASALATLADEQRAALALFAGLTDAQLDHLARQVLTRAMGGPS